MTRTEHLLTILAEECVEVAQRATKALRFGLQEVQVGQSKTNAERILYELADMAGVLTMLDQEGAFPIKDDDLADELIEAKIDAVEKWLRYSDAMGTLTP